MLAINRYQEDVRSRSLLEQAVVGFKRRWRYFTCLLRVPGLAMMNHLPAENGRWLLNQILAGKWWWIGPEAWYSHSKILAKSILNKV